MKNEKILLLNLNYNGLIDKYIFIKDSKGWNMRIFRNGEITYLKISPYIIKEYLRRIYKPKLIGVWKLAKKKYYIILSTEEIHPESVQQEFKEKSLKLFSEYFKRSVIRKYWDELNEIIV